MRHVVKIKRLDTSKQNWSWRDVTEPNEDDLRQIAILDAATNDYGSAVINAIGTKNTHVNKHGGVVSVMYFLTNTQYPGI